MDFLKLRMELHSHTDFDPQDWIAHSAEDLIEECARQKIDVLAITCHRAQQWSEKLVEFAHSRDVLLIPAVEASIEGKDVLIYGLERYEHPVTFETLRNLRRDNPNVLTIAPHPFYPARTCLHELLSIYEDCFDAIEYCHFYTRFINFNNKALAAARALRKPIVGTSDIHFLKQVGKTTSTVTVTERSFAAISTAIKAGRMELHTTPLTTREFASQIFQMKWLEGKSRLARMGLLRRQTTVLERL
jgi:predicted metal-dependent phosphoesterase TrpH